MYNSGLFILSIVMILSTLPVMAVPGVTGGTDRNGLGERVQSDTSHGLSGDPDGVFSPEVVHASEAVRGGTVTWGYEDWDGSYGAIANDVSVTADGSRMYAGWYLNYERIAAFDGTGSGDPIWENDLLDGGVFNVSGYVNVGVSSDGSVLVGSVSQRTLAGESKYSSEFFRLDIGTGVPDWSITMPATGHEPENTESITHMEISRSGNCIAVASRGYRQDPVFEPFHITICDNAGTVLHVIEIVDESGDISNINDLKLVDDGSRLVANFRMADSRQAVRVWELVSYVEIQSFEIANSPVQCSIGLSGDGGILATGDLHGRVRAYGFSDERAEYSEIWSYKIPNAYYYPWVSSLAVSRDGSIVAVGSYQPTQTESRGYFYLFNAVSGPPFIYKSENSGDLVDQVALSDSGDIGVASSWGPFEPSGPGWDFMAVSTSSATEVYRMDGSGPGSLFVCEIDAAGTRAVTGGKRFHAREMGSGGWVYSIELDGMPLPTATPTATQVPTPTVTPVPTDTPEVPTPTPTCPPTGAWCFMNQDMFEEGDEFILSVRICNNDPIDDIARPVFIILDVYGMYFCAPSWTDFDYYEPTIPACSCTEEQVLSFVWPSGVGEGFGLRFYCAMTNPEITSVIGDVSICEFGYR
jgi:hypothetical protein